MCIMVTHDWDNLPPLSVSSRRFQAIIELLSDLIYTLPRFQTLVRAIITNNTEETVQPG